MQVLVDLDGGGVIAIFPKRALHSPSLVVLLGGAPGDELHTLGNHVWPRVFDQKMYMVGCNYVIEDAQTKAFLGLEHPMQVAASVAGKFRGLELSDRLNDFHN